jgi:hypothetical protein
MVADERLVLFGYLLPLPMLSQSPVQALEEQDPPKRKAKRKTALD